MKNPKVDCCNPYELYVSYHRTNLKNFLMNWIKWKGLPDSIDERFFNDSLIMRGFCTAFKFSDGKVYVTDGSISGLDEYYRPTKFTAANIKFQGVKRDIGKDCAVCYNTYDYSSPYSLSTMIEIYARRLADIDLSIDTSVKNSRVCIIPVVKDEKDALRTAQVLKDMYEGKPATLAFKTTSFDGKSGIEIFPVKSKDNIVVADLADARRNIMADFYSELGIDNLAVDKKERTNLEEMNSNKQRLAIAGQIFLEPRKRFAEEVNAMFGLNIEPEFNMEMFKEVDVYENNSSSAETAVD